MVNIEQSIYGIPIVPYHDENGLLYGGFEGIVISCSAYNYELIDIIKMINDDGKYTKEAWLRIPAQEVLEHSSNSGKEKIKFLISKAKMISNGNEEIAICSSLVPNLILMDEAKKIKVPNDNKWQKVLK